MALFGPSDTGSRVTIAPHLADTYGAGGTIDKITRYGVHVRLESGRVERFGFQGSSSGRVGWQSNLIKG